MNLGAEDYLTKPVNLDDLLAAVNARLGRRQGQGQRQQKQLERTTPRRRSRSAGAKPPALNRKLKALRG